MATGLTVKELSEDRRETLADEIVDRLRGLSEADAVEIIELVKKDIEENLIVGKVIN